MLRKKKKKNEEEMYMKPLEALVVFLPGAAWGDEEKREKKG